MWLWERRNFTKILQGRHIFVESQMDCTCNSNFDKIEHKILKIIKIFLWPQGNDNKLTRVYLFLVTILSHSTFQLQYCFKKLCNSLKMTQHTIALFSACIKFHQTMHLGYQSKLYHKSVLALLSTHRFEVVHIVSCMTKNAEPQGHMAINLWR